MTTLYFAILRPFMNLYELQESIVIVGEATCLGCSCGIGCNLRWCVLWAKIMIAPHIVHIEIIVVVLFVHMSILCVP